MAIPSGPIAFISTLAENTGFHLIQSRVATVQILTQLFDESKSKNLTDLLAGVQENIELKNQGLVKEMCFGVCRHYLFLKACAEKLMKKPLKKKDLDIQLLILTGLYQLEFMRVPDHAAINETVNGCKTLKKAWARGLINAVLRNYLRERTSIHQQLELHTSTATSHPQWFVDALTENWPSHSKTILAANNQQAPLTLRVNEQKISRALYLEKLTAANIDAKLCSYSAQGITLEQAINVEDIPGFFEGLCSIQDEAAQLACSLLQLAPKQTVLDACCAPGGKTCHILEQYPEINSLIALDREAHRLEKVHNNLERLQLSAKLKAVDAAETEIWWDKKPFDRILLDAPCSATGIIRRHPDIKWLKHADDITLLAGQQLRLLEALWPSLAPGGVLLYATCSVLKQENENVVSTFLNAQHDAKELPIIADWGIAASVGRQLFPEPGAHDGFYYARITKCISPD